MKTVPVLMMHQSPMKSGSYFKLLLNMVREVWVKVNPLKVILLTFAVIDVPATRISSSWEASLYGGGVQVRARRRPEKELPR